LAAPGILTGIAGILSTKTAILASISKDIVCGKLEREEMHLTAA
jgi:hypothetical protein